MASNSSVVQSLMGGAGELSSIDPSLAKLLNQSLRDKLNRQLKGDAFASSELLINHCCKLVECLLANTQTHEQLVDYFADFSQSLIELYQSLELTEQETTHSYVNATGLVMAVKDAVSTVNDIYRVKAFIRALKNTLDDAESQSSQPLHLVYPACGPFAPLVLPLLCYVKKHNTYQRPLKVTLIDIQPGAQKVLNRVVGSLGLEHSVEVLCMDVMDYQPSQPIDILVIEAMQHGLSKEGHLSFMRHLAQFLAKDAYLLPKEIVIEAILAVPQREFVEQWHEQARSHSSFINAKIKAERINLGPIFTLNLDTLKQMAIMPLGNGYDLIEAGQVSIPHNVDDMSKRILLLSANLHVDEQEQVAQYDSGITHPLADMSVCIDFKPKASEPDDLLVKGGDKLKFYYKLCGMPGFLPTIA
ncbi:hypothetical protein HG263_17655 [Pseudoalteromonas sp. JBTF-M23]|uniref:Uncharacterized protein n=1 Tax=Pseudoalteromonas caenipelagi TaxID=2726988 RepID=A0A849VHQ5_9GAMM|nr:hypothetical protein [Pseudoalteromonas caenipelagi]NOU52350.1 hypothetical protein [Pseudoalteromonas caenipelagi]